MVTLEHVISFLQDEGLANPIKISNENDPHHWKVHINDPFIEDTKKRMGIMIVRFTDKYTGEDVECVVFHGFKSAACLTNDKYSGDWYNFVRLVKKFETRREAKDWFDMTYIYRGQNLLKRGIGKQNQDTLLKKKKTKVLWPVRFKRLDLHYRLHYPYVKYLYKTRKVPLDRIKNDKIFVDIGTQRIIFPIYDEFNNGELISYAGRLITQNPYQTPWIKPKGEGIFPVWNLNNVNGEELWLFEGIFDAIQHPDGVALLGVAFGNIKNKILRKHFSKYIIVMDNDDPGRRAKIAIATELRDKYHKCVYIYDYAGIDSQEAKDFGEMAVKGIPFDIENRVIPFTFKTEVKIKMGKVI